MYEIVRIVSLVMLWFAVSLNIYAAVINFRGYQRNRRLSKCLNELIEFFEEKTNILNDNNDYKEKRNDK